jgi:hypothetical protein
MAAHALGRTAAGLGAALAALAPGAALACPYCAGRSGGGIANGVVIGAFVFLPFLVSWLVYRVVRAGTRDEEAALPRHLRPAASPRPATIWSVLGRESE